MNYRTRKLVKPGDLNGRNTLFGGVVMAWIDEECAIYAQCQLEMPVVTKLIGEINFQSPAYQNDVVEIGVDVMRFGKTSITLRAEVRNKTTQNSIVVIDEIVMVAIDEQGKPVVHGKSFDTNYG